MKKILFLFVSVLALGLASCNKDDDNSSSIEGTWEFTQYGELVDGQEDLESYVNDCSSKKDYLVFSGDNVVKSYDFDTDCSEDVQTGSWSKDGDNLTTTFYGESFSATIKELNSTTLKIYSTETEAGVTTTYIDVLTRK